MLRIFLWGLVFPVATLAESANTIAVYSANDGTIESVREFHFARRDVGGYALIFSCGAGERRYAILSEIESAYTFVATEEYKKTGCPLGTYVIRVNDPVMDVAVTRADRTIYKERLRNYFYGKSDDSHL